MQWVSENIVGSRARLRLLRRLYDDASLRSVRELAKEVGCSHTHAANHLRALEEQGVIIRRRVGSANTFVVNDKSYLVRNVINPMFEAENNYLRELASRFSDGLGNELIRIVLFGSFAKGEAGPTSDVDLVLVVKDNCDLDRVELDAAGIASDAIVEFGRSIDALVFRESDFELKVREGLGMWQDLEAHGVDLLERIA